MFKSYLNLDKIDPKKNDPDFSPKDFDRQSLFYQLPLILTALLHTA